MLFKNRFEDHAVTFRSKEILFPKDEFDVGDIIKLNYFIDDAAFIGLTESKNQGKEKMVKWVLYADDMLPKDGEIPFSSLYDF
jgi:hypothetical protein